VITVFYDGKCGLCRREIDHYKRVAPEAVFHWVDITIDAAELEKLGISYADGLRVLHARDSDGKIHRGIDAFILIWQQMPRWRLLARIIALPIIRMVANKAYDGFAVWRFERLNHCQLAVQIKEKKDAR
jgi:predicted DCC family thiol-disulfide oxidoreductase YuxK